MIVRRLVARLDPYRFAIVATSCITVLGVMGSLWAAGARVRGFDLRGETNFPSAFSAGLLWLVALFAILLACSERPRSALLALAAGFTFLGFDEFLEIHEDLQDFGGLPLHLGLAPIALATVLLIVAVARQLRIIPGVVPLFVGGVASWAVSQVIDTVQPHGRPHWGMVPEELLEMAGSALFVLALLVALRAVAAPAAMTVRPRGRLPEARLPHPRAGPRPTTP